jgi:serine/threonine-protein kinase
VPALCGGVLLAGLSLDRRAITAASVVASGFTVALIVRLQAPLSELVVPLFAVVAIGVMCAYLVSRIEGLVAESRRKDFAGKYVLGERIGAGGMAEVFTAIYSPEGGFERRVAVKRVLPAHAGDENFVALFRREAELGAQLAHPNLVQVLDFGRHDDSWFLAMEFVDGVSLSALLKALRAHHARLPLPAALFVIAEVAEGLAYLHEKRSADGTQVGLVHRDLNPPNVLLSRGGDVKLSDFGVTRWSTGEGLTDAGTTRGKLAYMAPEQVSGGTPLPAWDLFALGATAWEVVVGARLFSGENESRVLQGVLEAEVPAPSVQRPDVPPEVDAVVLGLLAKDKGVRTQTAREVAVRLRQLGGDLAPYPRGRELLAAAIEGAGPQAPAQAPISGSSENSANERTRTVTRG